MFLFRHGLILLAACSALAEAPDGGALYRQYCAMCHQPAGLGLPGVFPPLKNSDYLLDDTKPIRALLAGLSGEIFVSGRKYSGVMPAAPLNDEQIAAVLSYARTQWGNKGKAISAGQVEQVRKSLGLSSLEKRIEASGYLPLPKPPAGFKLREVARPPANISRVVADNPRKRLIALSPGGDLWDVSLDSGKVTALVAGSNYFNPRRGDVSAVGMTLDPGRRLIVVLNQRVEGKPFATNEVTLFRSGPLDTSPPDLKPWFRTNYPYGIGPYNHGVGHAAFGPDGMLYVSSGSRTDGNEPGRDPRYFPGGETELTACIWRINPGANPPSLEIFARGLRNPFGFCWDDEGSLFATDNGPDAHAPEELNRVVAGGHYGFPFKFSDWTEKPYPYTPDPPPRQAFRLPVRNLGPDGGFTGKPISTFDPHSSPSGIIHLGGTFPASVRGTFLVARFGNLLPTPRGDVGYDLLQVRVQRMPDGSDTAIISTFLSPLARPVDLHLSGNRIYITEYARSVGLKAGDGLLPGRILELAPETGNP